VFSVYEEAQGTDDDEIIQKAFDENWILITSNKDFGEKVYREQKLHPGVILLRLDNERSTKMISASIHPQPLYGHRQILANLCTVRDRDMLGMVLCHLRTTLPPETRTLKFSNSRQHY
jgi:Domain of unknown function (DUF5615)